MLDFVNDHHRILKSFQDYYEGVATVGDVDPQKLYQLHTELMRRTEYDVLRIDEINKFADVFFQTDKPKTNDHGRMNALVDHAKDRFEHNLDEDDQETYRSKIKGYLSMYAFIAQVVNFTDADLEKLYIYLKFLLTKLPKKGKAAPVDINGYQEIEYYKINKAHEGTLGLVTEGESELYGPSDMGGGLKEDENEFLSALIERINNEFGSEFEKDDLVMLIEEPIERLKNDPSIRQAHKVNDFVGFSEALKQPYEDCLLEQHEDRASRAERGSDNIENLFGDPNLLRRFFAFFAERLHKELLDEAS